MVDWKYEVLSWTGRAEGTCREGGVAMMSLSNDVSGEPELTNLILHSIYIPVEVQSIWKLVWFKLQL